MANTKNEFQFLEKKNNYIKFIPLSKYGFNTEWKKDSLFLY